MPHAAPSRLPASIQVPTPHSPELNALALCSARDAHERHFSSRRGTFAPDAQSDAFGVVIYYDNNPYSDDAARRHLELAQLTVELHRRGVPLLARASYPTTGLELGYSEALVFRGDAATIGVIHDVWRGLGESTREAA